MGARALLLSWSLALTAGLACSLGDGYAAPCLHDESCASGSCHWGICVAGTCSGHSGCPDGWSCVDPPPSSNGAFLDALFGKSDPVGHCALDCDGCPDEPRYSCDSVCTFDHQPHLTLDVPMEARIGEPIPLRATVDLVEGRELDSATWSVQGNNSGERVERAGLDVEHTFTQYGQHRIEVVVIDEAAQSATEMTQIDVCAPADGPCEYDSHCCDEGYCEDGSCHPAAACGNDVIERGELCDGPIADGTVCTDFEGREGGPLQCSEDCTDYDLGACDYCGDTFADCTIDADCCPGLTCTIFCS